jgi:predicted nucleic acid-binding protein
VRFLVDANVLSEPTKPSPAAQVVAWLKAHEDDIVVDPVILGELRFGILLLPKSKRRSALEQWFDNGARRLHSLPWDAASGLRWAELLASLRRAGRAMPVKDSLIATTALVHDLTVVTRNQRDFAASAVRTLDPFA